jgi:hypothetical protein
MVRPEHRRICMYFSLFSFMYHQGGVCHVHHSELFNLSGAVMLLLLASPAGSTSQARPPGMAVTT